MNRTVDLYEDAKRLHDMYEGIWAFGEFSQQTRLTRESQKKMLYFKTCSVILQDKYLNEQEGEDLDNHIPVVTDIVS